MYGLLSDIQFAAQASFGTSNVASQYQVPFVKESLALTVDQLLDPAMYGRFGESPHYQGKRGVGGGIDTVPMPTFLGLLLYGACGRDAVTFAASIATHKFRPLDVADWDSIAALPPFSVLVNRDVASAFLYYDTLINGLTLDFANGELLKATVDLLGGKYIDNAKVAAVQPVEKEITWDQFSVSYGGQGMNVRRGQVKLMNNLTPIYLMGNSIWPAFIKRSAAVQVQGNLTLQFTTASHYADFIAATQTERQLLVNFQSIVGSPSNLKIDVPKTRLMRFAPQVGGPGPVEVQVDFAGKYDTTSSYQLEFTMVNTRAAYP